MGHEKAGSPGCRVTMAEFESRALRFIASGVLSALVAATLDLEWFKQTFTSALCVNL